MDQHSLELLEFPKVREIIAGHTAFSASREMALDMLPQTDADIVGLLLKQSAEARRLLSTRPDFGIGPAVDVRGPAMLAVKGKVLEPQSLLDIQHTLWAARQVRSSIDRLQNEIPALWAIAQRISSLSGLEQDIARCISVSAEILDSASPRLAEIRQRQRALRQQLLERLETITRSRQGQKVLQEPIITEREGRFVVPVKAELRREIKGIVHDVSNTGATVFVEPWVTVDLGNEFRELVIEEKHEIERILQSLSRDVGVNGAEISANVTAVAQIDLALAKARYAYAARAVEPVIQAAKAAGSPDVLKLVNARHPLLKGKPVPMSVEIGRDFRQLIITGPNTGGKTVALKTIGLLTLMAQTGLPVPASEESSFPIFDGIFADIGDEQSIERTLSTFSWHIGNIVRIIGESTGNSMVLLDELGTSTDPEEGVALAQSVLLHFLSKGTMVVATTHFSDLKVFAHSTPGMQNASMDFDPVTLSPTYHLTVGVPGGSNALSIATKLGLPQDIVARAREMIAGGPQQVEAMLADLTTERQMVELVRRDLEKQRAEAEKLRLKLEGEHARLREEERALLRQTRDRLLEEAAGLQRQIREATGDLKKTKSRETVEQARRALASVRERMAAQTWPTSAGRPAAVTEDTGAIAVGDRVRILDTELEGTVAAVTSDGRQVEVQAGRTHVSLGIEGVEKVSVPSPRLSETISVRPRSSFKPVSMELDLRGKRAEEVYPLLDAYLNDAFMAGLGQVRIIHGFATGTVRQIVRDALAGHPLVKGFQPGKREEGGDGVTMVKL